MDDEVVERLKNGPRTKLGHVALIGAYFLAAFVGLLLGAEAAAIGGFVMGLFSTYKITNMTFPQKY